MTQPVSWLSLDTPPNPLSTPGTPQVSPRTSADIAWGPQTLAGRH
jgi:hypothetical protein